MAFKKTLFLDLLFVFLLSLVVLNWTSAKEIIDANDTIFPLNPINFFKERLYLWHSITGAGNDFSYAPAGLTWHGLQALIAKSGASIYLNQKIFLLIFFNLISFSSYFFFLCLFPKDRLPRLVGVVFYCFNPFLFNLWGNIQAANLAAYAFIPLWSGFFLKAFSDTKKSFFWAVSAGIFSVLFSAFGMNPQVALVVFLYFFFFLLFVLIDKVIKTKTLFLKDFLLILLQFSVVFILFNLFWLLPEYRAIFNGGLSLAIPSESNLRGWLDYLSTNTSLLNVIRMQGEWTWYSSFRGEVRIPFAFFYRTNSLLIAAGFLAFFLALAAIIKSKNNWRIFFVLILILGLFFSVGTKPPLGYLYLFLSEKIKFFSFFRSPWYKFSHLTIMAYAALASMAVAAIQRSRVAKIVAVLTISIQLFYSYPLLTGEVFPKNFKILTPFRFSIPDYVWKADKWLRSDSEENRIVVLPRQGELDYYRWGYGGSYQLLNLLSNPKPVLIEPSWTVMGKTEASEIVSRFYDSLYSGEDNESVRILRFLNVKYLLHKKDFYDDFDWQVGNPVLVSSMLEKQRFLTKTASFGEWDFYVIDPLWQTPLLWAGNKINFLSGDIATLTDTSLVETKDEVNIFSSEKDNLTLGIPSNFIAGGSFLKKISNYSPPPAYIRFVPGQFFYPYSLNKESKALKGANTLTKLMLLPFYGDKRLQEVKKILISKGKTTEVDWALGDYLQKLKELNSLVKDSQSTFNRPLVEPFQAIEVYLTNQEMVLTEINQKTETEEISLLLRETKNEVARSLSNFLSTDQCLRFEVKVGTEGKYDLYLFDQWFLKDEKIKIKGQINGQTFVTDLIRSSGNWLIGKNFDLKSGLTFIELQLPLPKSSPHLFFRQSQTIGDLAETPKIEFKKRNPTEYLVEIKNAEENFILVFSENFHLGWEAQIAKDDGGQSKLNNHFTVNGFANGWLVNEKGNFKILIKYRPQILYEKLLFVSGFGLLAGVIYLILKRK